MGFAPFWDYKPTNAVHADSPGVYSIDKLLSLSTLDEINLKCDVTDGSIVIGSTQPIQFSFVLDKPSGCKLFCEPETIIYKELNKSVLNTITFYLEDDNHKENKFNQGTLTFTPQLVKI